MDRDAFLVARITDWNKLNLVSGHASVFYAGTFVGQSYINTSTVADTMSISLGRDKRIIIKRDGADCLRLDPGQNLIATIHEI